MGVWDVEWQWFRTVIKSPGPPYPQGFRFTSCVKAPSSRNHYDLSVFLAYRFRVVLDVLVSFVFPVFRGLAFLEFRGGFSQESL